MRQKNKPASQSLPGREEIIMKKHVAVRFLLTAALALVFTSQPAAAQTTTEPASLSEVAVAISRIVRLAFLAPEIVEQIVNGCQPPELTAESLLKDRTQLPLDWESQHRMLGFSLAN
jgi:hypothetical protein